MHCHNYYYRSERQNTSDGHLNIKKTRTMNKLFTIMAAALLMMCGTANAQTSKKKTAAKAKVSAVVKTGIVGDATSAKSLELKTVALRPERIKINIDGKTDMSAAHIVAGNVVEVAYVKTSGGYVAKKITGNADYANAIGKWGCPDPLDSNKKMGVELKADGVAASVNMATLPYTRWELQGQPGKLILYGKSIGNGLSFDVQTTVTISKKNGKWIMTDDDTRATYKKDSEL